MNFLRWFSQKYRNNWKFYPSRGFGGGAPRLANFYDFSLNFPLATLVFPKIHWSAPTTKDDNSVLAVYGGSAAKPNERKRKFKIFTEKSDAFYEILKEFNVNDNSSIIRTFSWFFAEFLEIFCRFLRKTFKKLGKFFKVLLFYHTVSKTFEYFK